MNIVFNVFLLITFSANISAMTYYQRKGELSEQEIEKMAEQQNISFELGEQLNKLAWPNVPKNLTKIERLLKAGANPNINVDNHLQECLLHKLSLYDECSQLVELLLKYEANPHKENCRGCTPLHFAAFTSAVTNTTLLLKANAKVNACDYKNATPLHYLLRAISRLERPNHYHNLETAKILINAGAELKQRNRDAETPIDLAIRLTHRLPHLREFDYLFRKKVAQDLFEKLKLLKQKKSSYFSWLPLNLLQQIALFATDEKYREQPFVITSFSGDI